MECGMRRVAVVLFNLGGPDRPEAVRPFLENLFLDPAILRVPGFVRPWLGRLIARRRASSARAIYAQLGGSSPLLRLTEGQATALATALNTGDEGVEYRCFVAMRYWHPFAAEAARQVKQWGAEEAVLLPLYPQYSTTTSGSSLTDWAAACRAEGLTLPGTTLCCWHSDPGFAEATASLVRRARDAALARLPPGTPLRVLFSAHGLPESIVKRGDPYQWQVERTVAAVVGQLAVPGLDYAICYQSRVTPQKWLGPSTEAEVERAAHDKVAVLVCPIAFVSDHSETLVELDVEYRDLAAKAGVPGYFRVPAQNDDPAFIAALAALVKQARGCGRTLCSYAGGRQCPKPFGDCPHAKAQAA
jgi:protoporphyrin/coproporphyrin ferrochelatase